MINKNVNSVLKLGVEINKVESESVKHIKEEHTRRTKEVKETGFRSYINPNSSNVLNKNRKLKIVDDFKLGSDESNKK